MKKISIEEAEQRLFEMLDKEDIGDVIYEAVRELFMKYVRRIEDGFKVTSPDILDRYEEWYDGVQDSFMEAGYDKMLKYYYGKTSLSNCPRNQK